MSELQLQGVTPLTSDGTVHTQQQQQQQQMKFKRKETYMVHHLED